MRLPKSVFLSVKLVSTNPATRKFVLRFGRLVRYYDVLYRYIHYNGAARAVNRCSLAFYPAVLDEVTGLTDTAHWNASSQRPFYRGNCPDYSAPVSRPAYGRRFNCRHLFISSGGPENTTISRWTPGTLELTVIEKCCPYS